MTYMGTALVSSSLNKHVWVNISLLPIWFVGDIGRLSAKQLEEVTTYILSVLLLLF